MSVSTQAQNWPDSSHYPFESKYFQVKDGQIHYVDEGKGDVILFVHGTPTWSFLYRDFIKEFSANYRCIAIDHLGFGLSEKPDSFSGTPQAHSKNLMTFIEQMDLQNITLVVHDFGGPIGLAAAIRQSDRIEKVVLFNSWLWSNESDKNTQQADKIVNSWLGRFLYLNLNFSPRFLLKKGFAEKQHLTRNIQQHYLAPFPNKSSRYALLNIARALMGASVWYEAQWVLLDRLAAKEWLILWGTEDPFFSEQDLQKWKTRFPKAQVEIFDCGHFVQEEATQEAVEAMQQFLE